MPTRQSVVPANSKYASNSDQSAYLKVTENTDRLAFNSIVIKYRQPIYKYCYQILKNKDEAEDATQEVFLRAYTKLDTYDDRHKFSTWLYSIAFHYCIDRLRKRQFQLISWDGMAAWQHLPDQNSPQPECAVIETETIQDVQELLNTLSPEHRQAVFLKYWQCMSYQEIAETLNTTVSAVKSRLFRARRMMASHNELICQM